MYTFWLGRDLYLLLDNRTHYLVMDQFWLELGEEISLCFVLLSLELVRLRSNSSNLGEGQSEFEMCNVKEPPLLLY